MIKTGLTNKINIFTINTLLDIVVINPILINLNQCNFKILTCVVCHPEPVEG